MTVLARSTTTRYFPASYSSGGVSDESNVIFEATNSLDDVSTVTCGQQQAALFQKIIEAGSIGASTDWDGEDARPITAATVGMAIELLFALPVGLPAPDITPEATGEIAFEWFRDRRNLVVITVDGQFVRWAALLEADPVSGSEPFMHAIPTEALDTICAVIS